MKKILTVLIMLIASGLFAQDTTWKANPVPPKVNGMYNQVYNGRKPYVIGKDTVAKGGITAEAVYLVNQSIAVTGTVSTELPERLFDSLTSQIGQLTTLISSLHPSYNLINTIYCVPDTNGMWNATKDSILITARDWFSLSAVTRDSTMWVSFKSEPSFSDIQTVYAGSLFNEKLSSAIASENYVYFWYKTSNHIINVYGH